MAYGSLIIYNAFGKSYNESFNKWPTEGPVRRIREGWMLSQDCFPEASLSSEEERNMTRSGFYPDAAKAGESAHCDSPLHPESL